MGPGFVAGRCRELRCHRSLDGPAVAAPEGVTYFDGPLHDADQLFWEVLVPIASWPWVTFGMLGTFGVLFV